MNEPSQRGFAPGRSHDDVRDLPLAVAAILVSVILAAVAGWQTYSLAEWVPDALTCQPVEYGARAPTLAIGSVLFVALSIGLVALSGFHVRREAVVWTGAISLLTSLLALVVAGVLWLVEYALWAQDQAVTSAGGLDYATKSLVLNAVILPELLAMLVAASIAVRRRHSIRSRLVMTAACLTGVYLAYTLVTWLLVSARCAG